MVPSGALLLLERDRLVVRLVDFLCPKVVMTVMAMTSHSVKDRESLDWVHGRPARRHSRLVLWAERLCFLERICL